MDTGKGPMLIGAYRHNNLTVNNDYKASTGGVGKGKNISPRCTYGYGETTDNSRKARQRRILEGMK